METNRTTAYPKAQKPDKPISPPQEPTTRPQREKPTVVPDDPTNPPSPPKPDTRPREIPKHV